MLASRNKRRKHREPGFRPKIRPGLKIRTKLLLLVLLLLAIPWMGYKSVREMENFLLEGQQQALELTAQGIASLLGNRRDLFALAAGVPEVLGRPFYIVPQDLIQALPVDAAAELWAEAIGELTDFSGFGLFECNKDYQPDSFALRHGLGAHENSIFSFFDVTDDSVIFRDPEKIALDHNDQLRMTVQDKAGATQRYLLTAQAEGRLSIYRMKRNWREPETGEALREIVAVMELTSWGYAIKLRIPGAYLGTGSRLKFELVDVDDKRDRKIEKIISTEPDPFRYDTRRIRLMTPELAKLIQPLYLPEGNITIWDRYFRLRAELGSIFPEDARLRQLRLENPSFLDRVELAGISLYEWVFRDPEGGDSDIPDDSSREDRSLLQKVLAKGQSETSRRRYGDARLIVTAVPIWAQGEIEGAILIKQSGNKLLALQYGTLRRFTVLFLGVFLFLTLAILIFSSRLTYRVGKLQRETELATTPEGRLLKDRIVAGARASDELGSLTRSISLMLQNLGHYTRYLEKLPDTLAHELHNPLNVVNSSLENLQYQHAELTDDKYLQRARNGLNRLRSIITSLTEAVNLKDALIQGSEQFERFDFAALVTNCVEGYQAANPAHRFLVQVFPGTLLIDGAPDRLAQLLDKLVDNAIEFGKKDGLITVTLHRTDTQAQLTVANQGSLLPEEIAERLFDPMVSSGKDARKTHLGLGLYIVRLVADFHGGTVQARNRRGLDGVEVTVTLPRPDRDTRLD